MRHNHVHHSNHHQDHHDHRDYHQNHNHLLFGHFRAALHWHHLALPSRTRLADIPDHDDDRNNDDDRNDDDDDRDYDNDDRD